jgi:hypothetical protein
VGIEARGRTTILRLNYRNTAEVLGVACEFAREVLTPAAAEEDGVPLVEPASAGRHGPPPELVRLPSLKAEAELSSRARPSRSPMPTARTRGNSGSAGRTNA